MVNLALSHNPRVARDSLHAWPPCTWPAPGQKGFKEEAGSEILVSNLQDFIMSMLISLRGQESPCITGRSEGHSDAMSLTLRCHQGYFRPRENVQILGLELLHRQAMRMRQTDSRTYDGRFGVS